MAVGRTTGGKKNYFLVAICFCYLLEVTVSEEKKNFVCELTLTVKLVDKKKILCNWTVVFLFFR